MSKGSKIMHGENYILAMEDNDYKNTIVRIINNSAYFFDEKGVYRKINMEYPNKYQHLSLSKSHIKLYPMHPKIDWVSALKGGKKPYHTFRNVKSKDIHTNIRIEIAVIAQKLVEDVDTIETFKCKFKNFSLQQHKYTEYELLVGKMGMVRICRDFGNTNTKTFDYIAVDVYITEVFKDKTIELIQKYRHDINKNVLSKVENSKYFQKYGIPINMIKVSKSTYNGSFIEYTLELKIS